VTVATDGPIFPPGRYGRRRQPGRRSRLVPAALLVAVVIAGLWLAAHLYRQYGSAPYRADVPSVTQTTDSSVTMEFVVHKSGGGAAACRVQAKDFSGAEVGYAEVPVPAGRDVPVRYTLATSARAYGVTVLGCQAAAAP
jgi:hypothetical protein